jgi:hypothetical protein
MKLKQVIEKNQFYPELVGATIEDLLGYQAPEAFLLDLTTSFEHDGLVRQQLILVIAKSNLYVCYTEELPLVNGSENPSTLRISTEVVPISAVGPFQVQRYYQSSADGLPTLSEIVLGIGWTGNRAIDFGPAGCDDPDCENEHGYSGQIRNSDYTAKYSVAVDGEYWIEHAERFASSLSSKIGKTG